MSTTSLQNIALTGCEVWVPAADKHWELIESTYQKNCNLHPVSSICSSDEGLLAQVLEKKGPIVSSQLEKELDWRQLSTPPEGLSGAIAIPSFLGEELQAVLLLFIACEGGKAALEIWGGRSGTHELSLHDGIFPGLERFGSISRFVHLPFGSGLPGRAWSSGLPQLMRDIAKSKRFLRSSGAGSEGLSTSLSLPIITGSKLNSVVNIISFAQSPIGRCYEIWTPELVHGSPRLSVQAAHYGDCENLAKESPRLTLQPGQGLAGEVWAKRRPIVWSELPHDGFVRYEVAEMDGVTTAIGYPIVLREDIRAIVLIMF